MTNKSTIQPHTFHVRLPWLSISEADHRHTQYSDWLTENITDRVDVFGYETDDPMDHFHYYTMFGPNCGLDMNFLLDDDAVLVWADMVDAKSGRPPEWLFCFHEANDATLFKLTWGGN